MATAWFSGQRYLQQRDGTVSRLGGGRRAQWVVARSLCHYRCFDLAEVAAARRNSALALQVRQWSPIEDYALCVVWQRAQALVWVWPRSAQQQALQIAGVGQPQVLPESLLRPVGADGVRLSRCAEGVEAQLWQGGVLLASHWWAETPAELAWQRFLRAHAQPLQALPEPLETPWLSQAWAKSRAHLHTDPYRDSGAWASLGAALLLAAAAWLGLDLWRWQQALNAVQAEIDAASDSAGATLEARNRALADREKVDYLLSLNRYPGPLELLANVADNLSGTRPRLLEWHYQTGELSFIVTADSLDPRPYVKAFQEQPFYSEVSSASGQNDKQLVMRMRLSPRVPPQVPGDAD